MIFARSSMKVLPIIKTWQLITVIVANAVVADSVLAHGANIKHRQTPTIVIQAAFDDGTPMSNAQAIVYSPEDPATPWLKGTTDSEGKFTFVPEPNISGNWDIKVRKAGHGDIVSIAVEGESSVADSEQNETSDRVGVEANLEETLPLQKFLMISTTVWGFIGTALFFARNREKAGNSEKASKL